MREIIRFTKEERNLVESFAEKIKWKHPHFLDKKNHTKRTEEQVKESVILGKLAEVAVQKYLKQHYGQLVSALDFNIYGEGVTDDFDILVGDTEISIKSSKFGSSCLMIEKQKFKEDDNGNCLLLEKKPLPDYFIFVRVNLFNPDNVYAEITGSISSKEFWKKKKFMPRGLILNKDNAKRYLMERKRLPELDWNAKGTKLLADNYGVHVDALHDLTKLLPKGQLN
ncbi:hypothetical protein CVD28_03015 [Bacillus sp. M6-12]|uniref:hypothetical protein n=1 Tax=Bacillus sp. M6-12 TaxID=2054166 RepID=UPI000C78B637|nr:hypothetical protein [Bacillus sp. M6-12]PLS19401.1 hypothetical protein CVD28_03015 [Bacillus sp. M6-12]